MPNQVFIEPRYLAIVLFASLGQEVSPFIPILPILPKVGSEVMKEVGARAFNGLCEYRVMAAGLSVLTDKLPDPAAPLTAWNAGLEKMGQAGSPQEAAVQGLIASSALIIVGVSTETPNAAITCGGLLAILAQVLITGGAQCFLSSTGVLSFTLCGRVILRVITEIRCELTRRRLGLPRVNICKSFFQKEESPFVISVSRLKKRKVHIFKRKFSVPIIYRKKIKELRVSPKVEFIPVS